MSTYTGTTGTKRGMGETIWLAVITFVAASALVLALLAVQRGGSTSPATVGGRPPAPAVVSHQNDRLAPAPKIAWPNVPICACAE
jgi:hypothetical protein